MKLKQAFDRPSVFADADHHVSLGQVGVAHHNATTLGMNNTCTPSKSVRNLGLQDSLVQSASPFAEDLIKHRTRWSRTGLSAAVTFRTVGVCLLLARSSISKPH